MIKYSVIDFSGKKRTVWRRAWWFKAPRPFYSKTDIVNLAGDHFFHKGTSYLAGQVWAEAATIGAVWIMTMASCAAIGVLVFLDIPAKSGAEFLILIVGVIAGIISETRYYRHREIAEKFNRTIHVCDPKLYKP